MQVGRALDVPVRERSFVDVIPLMEEENFAPQSYSLCVEGRG
jgi:hypothetical protein